MQGFFTKQETQSESRPDGRVYSCASCGLYQNVKSPRMEAFGNFRKRILNIGEAPSEVEDEKGKQWQGKTGKLLERTYEKLGINLFEDCLNINAVNCHPVDKLGSNRKPTDYEIACCRKRVMEVIAQNNPAVIVLLGGSAIVSLISYRWKKDLGGIFRWRGWTIPDRDFGAWICPTFHPSFVERSKGRIEQTIWEQDLGQILNTLQKPFPPNSNERKQVEIIDDPAPLEKIQCGLVAFDYETTGLRPHEQGHRIICASVADRPDHAYAFMMPATKQGRRPFMKLIENPNVGKIASNMKFEHAWSAARLGISVRNWVWDTMLAAHVLDNRPYITGLKFQTYIRFGVPDYASEVAPYLESGDKSANTQNKIIELINRSGGRELLLTYCGMDSLFEYRLALEQMKELGATPARWIKNSR